MTAASRRLLLLFAGLSLVTMTVSARVYHISQLPENAFADQERAASAPLTGIDAIPDPRIFKLDLQFTAASNRYVEVAWGLDSVHTNGQLSASEEVLAVAFDCGQWVVTKGVKEVVSVPAATTNGTVRLEMKAEFKTAGGELTSFSFRENGTEFTVSGFGTTEAEATIRPENWNLLRVTTRGSWDDDPVVTTYYSPRQTLIILR